jgi:hypothetical protein
MSSSDLYVLNQKSVTHIAEFRNGWGSAPVVWEYLGEKYVPEKPIYAMGDDGYMRKVWALSRDERLLECERVALVMTFDWAYVPFANLTYMADKCEEFFALSNDNRRENHWASIGASLRLEAGKKHHRHARGICISCTSVNDIWQHTSETGRGFPDAWPIFKRA